VYQRGLARSGRTHDDDQGLLMNAQVERIDVVVPAEEVVGVLRAER
jgi:hypothetical protein